VVEEEQASVEELAVDLDRAGPAMADQVAVVQVAVVQVAVVQVAAVQVAAVRVAAVRVAAVRVVVVLVAEQEGEPGRVQNQASG